MVKFNDYKWNVIWLHGDLDFNTTLYPKDNKLIVINFPLTFQLKNYKTDLACTIHLQLISDLNYLWIKTLINSEIGFSLTIY